jgi:hypothetical protein
MAARVVAVIEYPADDPGGDSERPKKAPDNQSSLL